MEVIGTGIILVGAMVTDLVIEANKKSKKKKVLKKGLIKNDRKI